MEIMKDYYRILDIPDTADRSEIEMAYKSLKEMLVKNSLSLYSILSADERDSLLNDIEEAYQTLTVPEKRTIYDLQIKGLPTRSTIGEAADTSRQLSFEFARDAFTFLDYTRLRQDLYEEVLNKIQKDHLLKSKGLSITIVEKEIVSSIDKQEETTSTPAGDTSHQNDRPDEYITDNPTCGEIQPHAVKQSEKETPPIRAKEGTSILQREATANLKQPEEEANTSTELKKECQNIIVIDENSEFSGHFLRQIRESMGITIKDIAQTTKISVNNIHNIEEENYNKLPPLVYTKGYLTQIAKCLNLRPDLVTRSYIARMNDRQRQKD